MLLKKMPHQKKPFSKHAVTSGNTQVFFVCPRSATLARVSIRSKLRSGARMFCQETFRFISFRVGRNQQFYRPQTRLPYFIYACAAFHCRAMTGNFCGFKSLESGSAGNLSAQLAALFHGVIMPRQQGYYGRHVAKTGRFFKPPVACGRALWGLEKYKLLHKNLPMADFSV